MLHGHQLPSSIPSSACDDAQHFVARVLAGKVSNLEPIRPSPIEDAYLEESQREAIARALATPDLCLIQGLPVTGKSLVAAEIIRRAAARGERVLLVAPHAASLDRTLELVQKADDLCAVRCLGREERKDSLPPWSRAFLFDERVRRLQEEAAAAAARQCSEAALRCAALGHDAMVWPHLLELAERLEQLLEQASVLAQQRDQIPAAVEAAAARVLVSLERDEGASASGGTDRLLEAPILAAMRSLAQARARIDESLSGIGQQIEQEKSRLSVRCAEQGAMASLAEAKAGRKWWTLAWWKAAFQGNVPAKVTELEARVREAREMLAHLEAEAGRLTAERRQAEEQARLERIRQIDLEIGRRRGELEDREAALRHEEALVEKKWADAVAQLHLETARPASLTMQAVREARAACRRDCDFAEKRRAFADEWAATLRDHGHEFALKLRECANLVAVPSLDLAWDEHFGESAAQTPVRFDLLVVEHAEQITEAELFALARRCRRWILLAESSSFGQAWELSVSRPSYDRDSVRSKVDSRRNRAAEAGVFQRLWNHLHCDPRRLPYAWRREADARLCCRLRPVSSEQWRWIETERVADHPEIELRIVAPPRGATASAADSFLAEVVFPAHTPLVDAKSYIFHELQEVPVLASVRRLRWDEQPDRFVLRLTDDAQCADTITCLDLTPGVREIVSQRRDGETVDRDSWVTRAVEFDRTAGWERRQVEEWTQRYLSLTDLGRTALLHAPQGMAPGLALFLSDVLFDGAYHHDRSLPLTDGPHRSDPAVEFVGVPWLHGNSKRSGHRKSGMVCGAGFETDVADAQNRDRLPADYRTALAGASGLVNYPEAQTLVRYLLRLVADWHAQADGRLGRLTNGPPPGVPNSCRLSIGIVALYAAQARLIRQLLERTPEILSSPQIQVRVDVPAAFAERESGHVLVSLTRSHKHRATSYGDGPSALICALTRGRDKLVLFGDAGTLARRTEWQGALDRLTEAASARERQIITRLVGYIQGQGRHAQVFQLRSEAPNSAASNRSSANRGQAAREGSNA
jgi:hypothetical protein